MDGEGFFSRGGARPKSSVVILFQYGYFMVEGVSWGREPPPRGLGYPSLVVSPYHFPPFQISCYQVRLAEDQELEEEKGDDSKDEGKTILKNELPSCAEWTFILEEMCELLLRCKLVFMSLLSIKPGVFALKSFHCVLVGDFASLVFLKPATKKLVSIFSVRVSS